MSDSEPSGSAPFTPWAENDEYIAPSHYAAREDTDFPKKPVVTLTAATSTSSLHPSWKTRWLDGIAHWRPALALALSVACFAAMVILLAVYSDKPLSTWSVQAISINTVVAVLTTSMRASMLVSVADSISQSKWSWFSSASETSGPRGKRLENLVHFDDASRGPWGSFWLLFETKLNLVSIGALLTVLALTLDAFSQQIVDIESRVVVNKTAVASFPRTMTYGQSNYYADGTFSYDQQEWWSGVYAGVYSSEIADLAVLCPTGNCTWPIVPSMGVCGACTDITDNLKAHCSGPFCNYTTPRGVVFGGGVAPGDSGGAVYAEPSGHVQLTNAPSPNSTFGPWKTGFDFPAFHLFEVGLGGGLVFKEMNYPRNASLRNLFQPIAQFDIIAVKDGSQTHNGSMSFRPPVATSCGLWFCLQAYSTIVEQGELQQSVIANYSMDPVGHSINVSDIPPVFNVSQSTQIHYPVDIARDLFFGPSYDGLYEFFNGSGFQQVGIMSFTTTSNQIQAMWANMGNYDAWISRLAKSLSNVMRSKAPSQPEADKLGLGDVLTSEIFIRIRWLWVILPAFIVLGAILFFAISTLLLQKDDEHSWRDSPLVLLLSDIDMGLKEKADTHYGSAQELNKVVGRQRVTLSQDYNGRPVFQSI